MSAVSGGGLLLHFDHKPRAIVAALANLRARHDALKASMAGSDRTIAAFILGGGALAWLDWSFGYSSHLYLFAGIGISIFGFWVWRRRNRAAKQPSFTQPELRVTSRIVHAIRDDIAPKQNLHGTLDLRGSADPGKVARTRENARGQTVTYYRDDWLSMKAKLWDGSMIRFAVIRKLKIRDGYYKRGRVSGKLKYKPPVLKGEVEYIDIRVSPNPTMYALAPTRAPSVGQAFGQAVVESVATDGGLVRLRASHAGNPNAEEILSLLLATYAILQPKDRP